MIASEADHLLRGGVWPETVAHTLGYGSASNLSTVLKKWGYPSLAARFIPVNFDGLVAHRAFSTYARKHGALI